MEYRIYIHQTNLLILSNVVPLLLWLYPPLLFTIAVKFFHSDRLGEDYKDDMFVGSIVKGDMYHFDLNQNRTHLILSGDLKDKIAETSETGVENIVFGENFAGISDLEVGPDGYLYVVSLGQGKIFKIVPSN